MEHKNIQDRYFKTSSFYLAVFLFAKGLVLVNVDKVSDPKRAEFVFEDNPEREGLIESFDFSREDDPSVLVDPRKMSVAIRQLKDMLYQRRF